MGKRYYFSDICYWDMNAKDVIRNNTAVNLPERKQKLMKKLLDENGSFVKSEVLWGATGDKLAGNWKTLLSDHFTRHKGNDKGLFVRLPEMVPVFERNRADGGRYKISISEENIVDTDTFSTLVQKFDHDYNKLLADLNEGNLDRTKWEAAKKSSETLTTFARKNLEELNKELPKAWIFPSIQCRSDTKQLLPLFYARVLLLRGKLLLSLKTNQWRDDDEKGFCYIQAKAIFRQAANIADSWTRQEQIEYDIEKKSGKLHFTPAALLISAEAQIFFAKCCAMLLKIGFGSERDITNRKKALDAAKSALTSHKERYGADERYNALDEEWKAADSIVVPSAAVFEESEQATIKLVYSTVFDSASAKTITLEETELFMLQLVASPVKIVLQLPQLLDNPNIITGLIHSPGFQLLCRKRKIVLSSYRPEGKEPIIDPIDYVKNALGDEKFCFSASEELNRPANKKEFLRGLQEDLPFQKLGLTFGGRDDPMKQEKLKRIYDGYRIASEIFSEDAVCRYHQDPSCRPDGSKLMIPREQLTLSQTMDARIRLLMEDEEAFPDGNRKQLLCRLQELQTLAAGMVTRSEYYSFIDKAEGYDKKDLDCFKRLVDICYGISSGFRCANLVLEHFSDGDLSICNQRVRVPQKDVEIDPAHMMETAIASAKRNAAEGEQVSAFDFEDVLYKAQTAGEYAEENKIGGVISEKSLTEGVSTGYMADLSGKAFAVAFCADST